MNDEPASQHAFRHQMVRAVVGARPAELFMAADDGALRKLSQSLTDWEHARAVLRQKGWGDIGTTLLEVVNAIPEKAKP